MAVEPAPSSRGSSPEHKQDKHHRGLLTQNQEIVSAIVRGEIVDDGEPRHDEVAIQAQPPGKQEGEIKTPEAQVAGGRFRMRTKGEGREHKGGHQEKETVADQRM